MKYISLVGIVIVIFATVFTIAIYSGHRNIDEITTAAIVTIPKKKLATLIQKPLTVEKKNHTIIIPVTLPNTVKVKARNGDCWIAYKVDDQNIIQYVLKKDKEVTMRGDIIKLRVANYKLVEISHNNKAVSIISRSSSFVTNLIFPENLKEELKAPYLSFAEDKEAPIKDQEKEVDS